MKKIIIAICTLCSLASEAQVKQQMGTYGVRMRRMQVDSALKIPTFQVGIKDQNLGFDTAQFYYNVIDSSVYVHTGTAWRLIKGSGGGTPAGNYGNIQLNRNSVFGVAATDSLNYNTANGLTVLNNVGINTPVPLSKLHITSDGLGITPTDASGIILRNTTPALTGAQQMSPSLVMAGNGFRSASGASRQMRWRQDVLPVQGVSVPTSTYQWSHSYDSGATYVLRMSLRAGVTSSVVGLAVWNDPVTGTYSSVNGVVMGMIGSNNYFFGNHIHPSSSGSSNLFMGNVGGSNIITGGFNVGINGLSSVTSGTNNTAVGFGSLGLNTTASWNTAVGYLSMPVNTGEQNTALGANSLLVATTAIKNVAIGAGAMENTTTGGFNTAVGMDAMLDNTEGVGNIGIGWNALSNNTGLHHRNIGIGYRGGGTITGGDNNIFIGNDAGFNVLQKLDAQNSIAIGTGAYTDANNQVIIGTSATTDFRLLAIAGSIRFHDVSLATASNGDVWTLINNATGEGGWAAGTGGAGLEIGVSTITSGTNGRVLYQAGGVLSQSANMTFDGTNFIIGGTIDASAIWCDGSQVFNTSGLELNIGNTGGFTSAVVVSGANARIGLGGNTSSFPGFQRSGANLMILGADGSHGGTSLSVGGTPVASAIATFTSTTQGLLLPRMTKAQRDAISSPVAGLAIYQTDNTPGLRVFNGTNWMKYTEATD